MTYAIISLGGKQYRVQEGQKLLVDRLPHDEAKTFHPDVLMLGGDGSADLAPKGAQVTARVVKHTLGKKILIGKYKPKKGYKKHIGHRSRLSQIEIEAIGKKAAAKPKAEQAATEEKPKAAAKPRRLLRRSLRPRRSPRRGSPQRRRRKRHRWHTRRDWARRATGATRTRRCSA
jgi:large subunit ribosomal protein L21